MVSSNKKRGKQRKAAKEQQTTEDSPSAANQLVVYTSNGETYIHPNQHKLMTQYFRRGSNAVTVILTKLTSEDVPTNGISWPNISLDQSGIVSSAVNFLKQCEDETFDKALADARDSVSAPRPRGGHISFVGGDLKSPSLWITILRKAIGSSGITSAIFRIRSLVICMCNDTERLFFKSDTHWRESIMSFVQLVSDMISNSTDKRVGKWLLVNERLLASIVQWNFWDDEHRPDIVDVLSVEKCTEIVALGREIVGKLVTIAADNPSVEDKQLLGLIGCMPIISKDYDSDCMISYTAGLICCMKKEEPEELINWANQRCNPLNTLQSLIYTGDCIDKDVIMGIIDLGTNHVHGYESAVAVANLSAGMLLEGTNAQPSDTRIALAIRAGLIEMCLNFVDRFGGHESFCDEDKSLYNRIESIFYIINDISLHQKTAKAIRSKRIVTEDKIVRLEDTITENDIAANDMSTAIIFNDKCKDLLVMVRSILNLNGSYCCRCIKQLSKTEVMQCNGCSCMVYCSKECQKEDWLNGHKLTCNKPCTNDNVGQFQGRFQPAILPEVERDASKLKELETNFNMIQLKLFLDHSGTILSQAKALDIPLCDCIVVFDRRNCPIKIEMFKYCHEKFFGLTDNGYFKSVEEREGFENSRSKDNITCVYASRMIIGDDIKDGDKPVLFMQRLFPHDWLTNKKV